MLKYKADRRTLGVVFTYFLFTILAWFFLPDQWYLRLPIIMVLCVLSFMCAVTIHNTIHHPIFKSKRANKIYQVIISFTYGHPVSAYVSGHNFSHHNHQQGPMDRIRTTQMTFRWNFLNQFLIFFQNAIGIAKDENLFAKKIKKSRPNWYYQYLTELVIVFSVKIALLIINWKLALLLIFIPHLYAAWGIVGTNFWQHDGCDKDHPYNHSRNFTGKFLNWIAFNNGYHTLHHNQPHLHWSLLPEKHKEIIEPYIHPNLNQKYLVPYLWKTLIYPAKRLDYLGNPVKIQKDIKYVDWVESADIEANAYQLGVEH